jgi:SAM-dependent methyltransferase
MNRYKFLKTLLFGVASTQLFSRNVLLAIAEAKSNFKQIYSNSILKKEFYKFLKNVFNLYPEDQLHKLIDVTTEKHETDKSIYTVAQSQLKDINPLLSTFRYQLPALFKQKDEMAKQTVSLLGAGGKYNGYLEIGSSGRYLDYLEEKVSINGKRYYADGKKPGYAVSEMIDRGQIAVGATYIPFTDYNTVYSEVIPKESLDLVTVYIGFHHCPIGLRTQFISSIRDILRTEGKLILRDHDCDTDDQKMMVALAHDVFNMGTNESWDYNNKEVRNFYSLKFICDFVENIGFKFDKRTLFQVGDPTKNALMLFTKI